MLVRRTFILRHWLLALSLAGLLLTGLPLAAAHAMASHHPAQPTHVLARHHGPSRPTQPGWHAAPTVHGRARGRAWDAGWLFAGAPAPLAVALLTPHTPRAPPAR